MGEKNYLKGTFTRALGPVSFESLLCGEEEEQQRGKTRIVSVVPSHIEQVIVGCEFATFILFREDPRQMCYQVVQVIPCEWTEENYLTKFPHVPTASYPFKEDYNEMLDVHEHIRMWADLKHPSKVALKLCRENKPFKLHQVDENDVTVDEWYELNVVFLLRHRMTQQMRTELLRDQFEDLLTTGAQGVINEMKESGELVFGVENGKVKTVGFKWLLDMKITGSPYLLDDVMITGNQKDLIPVPPESDFVHVKGIVKLHEFLRSDQAVLFLTNLETDLFPDMYYTSRKGVRTIPMKCHTNSAGDSLKVGTVVSVSIEDVPSNKETVDVWYDSNGHYKNRVCMSFKKRRVYKDLSFAHILKPSDLLKEVGVGYSAVVCMLDSPLLKHRATYVAEKQKKYRGGVKVPVVIFSF